MSARVLFYVRGLEEGGAEKQVERLACGLGRKRFHITVSYSDDWGPVGDRLLAAGIPVVQFPARNRAQAECVIRAVAPEIFHSFTHKDAVDIVAARTAAVPIVIASRVNLRHWDQRMEVCQWEHVRNRMTHRITAVSKAVASMCEKVEGVAPQNIIVIPNGIAIPDLNGGGPGIREELGLDSHVQLIGYVANYRPVKDHETLLRSFRLVLDRRPGTHLICCGIAPPETRLLLEGLVRELGLEKNVSLLESRSALGAVYRDLDLYVHSSRVEGMSNSILEAMAHSLPVVATDAGGNSESVENGVTGWLVRQGQAGAFAHAVTFLLDDPDRRKRFGQAGRERAERHFSADAMIEAYARCYDEAREARSSSSPRRAGPKPRLRVLYHIDSLGPGGLEKQLRSLVLGLDRNRYEPLVSWHTRWGAAGDDLLRAGVPVVRIAPTHGCGRACAVKQIRDLAPDIFHSLSDCPSSADVLNARAAGVPFIVTGRSGLRGGPEGELAAAWQIERNRATDRIVACSRAAAEACSAGEGVALEDIAVIHHGVALAEPAPIRAPASGLCIGYAAAYGSVNAHDVLLRAFRSAANRHPGLRLLWCSEPYDDTKPRRQLLCAELGLSGRVAFREASYDTDQRYQEMDIYAHPSPTEEFSDSILEAMAHALPVVASPVGATPEPVSDGVTGLLVPPGDAAALEQALDALLTDSALRRRLGQAGLERARSQFPIRATIQQHESLYEKLAARDSTPGVEARATGA